MEDRKQQLSIFFDRYSEIFNRSIRGKPDMDETAGLYADNMMAANPKGVFCGKNDEQMKDSMQKGYEFYKSVGISEMEIIRKEITILNDFYAMVKIRWNACYTNKKGTAGNVAFDIFYFVRTADSRHKVFAWITDDEQAVMKEVGLI